MSITRTVIGTLAPLALLCFAATAGAQPISATNTVTTTSTVTAIDHQNRLVTLKAKDGEQITLKVGEVARNFNQINVGDTVNATYTESLTLSLGTPGETPGAASTTTLTRAPVGSMPKGEVTNTLNVTALITAIDTQNRRVTFRMPSGRVVTATVAPEVTQFDQLKVNDSVQAVFTEAVAISVERN
jgi:hypothetical protein